MTASTKPETQTHDLALRQGDDDVSLPLVALKSEASLMMDPAIFEHMQRVCRVYAASKVVPAQFQGNLPDCMIAFELAHRMHANVFMLMQSMYVIQGKPGLEAKLVIALVNMRGPFRGPIQYSFKRDSNGKALACTAFGVHKATGDRCESTVTWEIVEKEGWSKKTGSKWLTMPEQMFMYRSAAWLARAYCPEVIMGMHTTDELDDSYNGTRYVENETRSTPDRVSARLGAVKPKPAVDDPPVDEPEQDDAATTTDDAGGEPAGDANAEATTEEQGDGPTPYERCIMLHGEKHGISTDQSVKLLGAMVSPDMSDEDAAAAMAKIAKNWCAPKSKK